MKILGLAGYNAASVSGNSEKATGPVVEAVFDALKKLGMIYLFIICIGFANIVVSIFESKFQLFCFHAD